jgi:hypothetical protein
MLPITSLWLPIVLSGLGVFIVSALMWTVMPHRQKEFRRLPDEAAARDALRVAPGEYAVPFAADSQEMKDPDYLKHAEEGPVGFVRIVPPGRPAMAKPMLLSLLYYLVVGVVVAYLVSRTLAPGTDYLTVFRVAGTVAWCAYFFAAVPDAIWFGKVFGSLWPAA